MIFSSSAIKRRFEKRIYIPLPDAKARLRMFELNVGTTPCQMTRSDYQTLAGQTDGYVHNRVVDRRLLI